MRININKNNMLCSYSSDVGLEPIDMDKLNFKNQKEIKIDTGEEYHTLDVSMWLPFAAPHYRISPNIRDYILVPVPSVVTELPNTNGDAVTKAEMLRFIPEQGMLAYKTFVGKCCFREHDNQDITKAKGIILDAYIRVLKGFGRDKHYKLIKLLAFDRTKDAALCDEITSGRGNSYSMGLYFDSYSCSICNNRVGKTSGRACIHTELKRPTYLTSGGRLAYRLMHDIIGFECSAVLDPAFLCAISDHVMNPQQQFPNSRFTATL